MEERTARETSGEKSRGSKTSTIPGCCPPHKKTYMNAPTRRANAVNSLGESYINPAPSPSLRPPPSSRIKRKNLTKKQAFLRYTLLFTLTLCFLDYVNLTVLKSNHFEEASNSLRGGKRKEVKVSGLSILLNTIGTRGETTIAEEGLDLEMEE